jgi:phosphatidylserine/phosphatidylglycerophosphate/cardiolipin synthase-like enzyme
MSERADEIYCHAKVWLVDDVCARIGSANCTRRSFTHDSEMDLIVVDGALDNGTRAFARRFRRELWGEQLGLADTAILEDHLRALALFRDPPPGSRLRVYDDRADETPLAREHAADWLDRLARHLRLEPERVCRAIAARCAAETPIEQAIDDLRDDPIAVWDLVDPDGRILE